jgi:hypothetical protein
VTVEREWVEFDALVEVMPWGRNVVLTVDHSSDHPIGS